MSSRKQMMEFLKTLWNEIQDDNVFNGAAALAYFFMLAIFPAAIFVLSLLPYLGIPHLQQAIVDLLNQVLPHPSAVLLRETVEQVISGRKGGLLTFGLLFTIWSASSGIDAAIEQVNMAYDRTDRRSYFKVRGISVLLMLFFSLLVVVSLSLVIFGGVVQSWVASLIGWSQPLRILFATLRWIILGIALLLGLAVIYRFGPDVDVKFRFISPGNVAGAILIALASVGVRFYVLKFGNESATYGDLGALVILMLWLYLAAIALLVGSEINALQELHKTRQSELDHSGP